MALIKLNNQSLSAVTALPSSISAGLTATNAEALSGASPSFTLPSGVSFIRVAIEGASGTPSGAAAIRIGTGGSVDTTGYVHISNGYNNTGGAQGYNSSNEPYWWLEGWAGGANTTFANIDITMVSTNNWVMTGHFYSAYNLIYTNHMMGYKSLSGELDTVQILPSANSFDAGYVKLIYQ